MAQSIFSYLTLRRLLRSYLTLAGLFMPGGLLVVSNAQAQSAGDSARGLQLYGQYCQACHSVEYNGIGPMHRGVFGRKAGGVSGFKYSNALKNADVIWSAKTLDIWLADPEKYLPGQKMGVQVPDAKDRADLIAYLQTLTGK
ncbi:c-type cytochrome [Ampullimonas aquatilis]|uniref:c-type cytochrome n=1 Tax=Ampullimonas aquatilis TaxID=1341549 RepID=UPI003C70D923